MDCAGLLGRRRPGSGGKKKRSSFVRNEKIFFLEGQALLGTRTWHSKLEEGKLASALLTWLYLMVRGGLPWFGYLTPSRVPRDAS